MKNFKAVIQYEGTKYQGWQKQERTDMTIQGKLEAILSRLQGSDVEVIGSGRTDAGVHATGQVANFHLNTAKPAQSVMAYMNQYLPEDIGVISVEEVPERFHARFHVAKKTYRYRVLNSATPHVFDRRYVYQITEELNVAAMRKAALLFCGTHDFKAFTSSKKGNKSTVRTIQNIQIKTVGDELQFIFTGDGFLYNMIRILMGTLLEVGMGKRKSEEMTAILKGKNRELAGPTVPAQGLCLEAVEYVEKTENTEKTDQTEKTEMTDRAEKTE